MKKLYSDFRLFFKQCKSEDFGFYMVAGYIIFSYLRPHVIFPMLDILPWAQICIILGLLSAAMKRKLKFQYGHFTVLMFAIACSLSAYFSDYPRFAYKGWDVPYIWFLEVLFFTGCINTLQKFRLITILFFLVLFKISFFGARTWVTRGFGFADYGIAGPSGYFQNSGELSLLMAMLTIMSLSILFKNSAMDRVYYLIPITAFMTVMAASSRGSQLALLAGSIIFFALKGKFKLKYVFMTIMFFSLAFMLLPEEQRERFSSAGEDNTSQSRLLYWSKGMDMLKHHPIVGVGYNSFPSYFHDHYAHEIPEDVTWGKRREVAHNTFIQVSSQMGILGFLTYLSLCLVVFSLNRNTRKIMNERSIKPEYRWIYQYSIGLDIAQIVFFVGAFFMSVAFYPYNYFMIMYALSMNNIVKTTVPDSSQMVAKQNIADPNLALGNR